MTSPLQPQTPPALGTPAMENSGVVEVECSGLPILLSAEANTEEILWLQQELSRNDFEPYVIRALRENVHESQCCFEVGSWIGIYSILLSTLVGRGGSLYLFEPDPVARAACSQNLFLNHCEDAVLLPFAVSDRNGERVLYNASEFGNSQSTLIAKPNARLDRVQARKVRTCTLDDFARMLGVSPDFVKIDVEGAEGDVIEGGSEVLGRRGVKCVIEVHAKILRRLGIDPASIVARLRALKKRTWLLDLEPREVTEAEGGAFTDCRTFHLLASD